MATALLSIESEFLPERQRIVLALGQTLSIGSSRLAHFQIPDPQLKPIHLRLTLARGGVFTETTSDDDRIQLNDRQLARGRIADSGQLEFGSVKITVSTFGLAPDPIALDLTSRQPEGDWSNQPHDTAEDAGAVDGGQAANDSTHLDFQSNYPFETSDQASSKASDDDFDFSDDDELPDRDELPSTPAAVNRRPAQVANADSLPSVLEEQSTENADDETTARRRTETSIESPTADESDSMTIIMMHWSTFRAGFWDYRISLPALELLSWLIAPAECRLISSQPLDSELLRKIGGAPGIQIYQANSIASVVSDIADSNYVVLSTALSDTALLEHVVRLKSTFQSAFSFVTKMSYATDAAVMSRMHNISAVLLPREEGDFSLIMRLTPVEFIAIAAQHRIAIVERPAK